MLRVIVTDRAGNPVREIDPADVFELLRTERINGEHSLSITTTSVLQKGQRILTQDARGTWREHVVCGIDEAHQAGWRPIGTYWCAWSVQPDLMGVPVSVMPGVQNPVSASTALASLLSPTKRWTRGAVDVTTEAGASMYDTNCWEAMGTLVEVWGGEVSVSIGVDSTRVTSRRVNLSNALGEQTAKRRYDFGADVAGIRRILDDSPLYCRISPRGAGEPTEGGGFGRKIRITSVNQGKDYLENSDMVDVAKLPDGQGGWEYPTLIVENPNIETPLELLEWARGILEESTVPKVTYEVDVLQAAKEGIDLQGVSLGDKVQVVDRFFGNLRIVARVVELTTDELGGSPARVVLGAVSDTLTNQFDMLNTRINQVTSVVYNINGGTMSTGEYLSRLLERLNAEANATGGYTYITEGQGIRTYDRAVSDPLIGAEASAVVEVKGGTVRIANTKTAQGEWVWRTVFTAGHIAGEVVTAAQIVTGYIGSSGGTFIDLDNNIVQLGADGAAHVVLDSASGLHVYQGSTELAQFGTEDSAPIAKLTDGIYVAELKSGEFVISRDGNKLFKVSGIASNPSLEFASGTSSGAYGVAMGNSVVASGAHSFATGYLSEASAYGAIAMGYNTKASEQYSVALGADTVSSGGYSFAAGRGTEASNGGAVALGLETQASGLYSMAAGNGSIASKAYSMAFGYQCESTGQSAFTTGESSKASAASSAAIGLRCEASGSAAVAVGNSCKAVASHSFAAGQFSQTAVGNGSAAIGYYAKTNVMGQVAVGKANALDTSACFIVGNGSSDTSRSTAFKVLTSGSAWLQGTLTQASDKRLKDHIAYLGDEASDFIRELKPALYEKDGKRHTGFYAQDVEDVDPWDSDMVETVIHGGKLTTALALSYSDIIAPLVAYCQKLEKRIEALENERD